MNRIPERVRKHILKTFLDVNILCKAGLSTPSLHHIYKITFDEDSDVRFFASYEDYYNGEPLFCKNKKTDFHGLMEELIERYYGFEIRGINGIRFSTICTHKSRLTEIVNTDVSVEEVNSNKVRSDLFTLTKLFNQPVLTPQVFNFILHQSIEAYRIETYYAYMDDELVGFMMKTKTSINYEIKNYSRITGKRVEYPDRDDIQESRDVVLMIAVDEQHRGKGIFNKLIQHVTRPYYVHLNNVFSPMNIWNKQGCEIVLKFDETNALGLCGDTAAHLNEMIFPMIINKSNEDKFSFIL